MIECLKYILLCSVLLSVLCCKNEGVEISLKGQITPYDSSNNYTIRILNTDQYENKFIAAVCVGNGGGTVTLGAGQVEIWNRVSQGFFSGLMTEKQGDGGTVTQTFNYAFAEGSVIAYTLNKER